MEVYEFEKRTYKDWLELSKLKRGHPSYLHEEVEPATNRYSGVPELLQDPQILSDCIDSFAEFEWGVGSIQECTLTLLKYFEADQTSEQIIGLGLSSDLAETVCKIRAFRSVISALENLYQKKFDIRIIGKSNLSEFSVFDSKMNCLRSLGHIYAGIVSGCDYILSYEHDHYKTNKSDNSKRLLENTFQILQEESWLSNVQDPWGGSYLIEDRTRDIAEKTWELAQVILKTGGYQSFIESDKYKSWVSNAKSFQHKNVFDREISYSGVNNYINEEEVLKVDEVVPHQSSIHDLEKMRMFFCDKKVKVNLLCFGELKNFFLQINSAVNTFQSLGFKTEVIRSIEDAKTSDFHIIFGEGVSEDESVELKLDKDFSFENLLSQLKKSKRFKQYYDEYESLS